MNFVAQLEDRNKLCDQVFIRVKYEFFGTSSGVFNREIIRVGPPAS